MGRENILLVEDERHIADVVEYILNEHGLAVRTAADGEEGLACFRRHRPDLVILDLKLPGIEGLDLFREMRRIAPRIPVIMLTSRTDEADRITGLELGADDYVTKPFSARELAARVRAVLRRASRPAEDPLRALRAGPVTLDAQALCVTCDGTRVGLSHQEFRLLECLLRHPARIFPRDALIDAVYDGEAVVTDRTVDAQVKRIRRKFAAIRPDVNPIQTVYGMGYKLNQDLGHAE